MDAKPPPPTDLTRSTEVDRPLQEDLRTILPTRKEGTSPLERASGAQDARGLRDVEAASQPPVAPKIWEPVANNRCHKLNGADVPTKQHLARSLDEMDPPSLAVCRELLVRHS